MKKTKTKSIEESIVRRFDLMKDVYSSGATFFPATVFVDFKWGQKSKDTKEDDMSICVPFKSDSTSERMVMMKRLGFAVSILEKLKLTSAPEHVIIAAEAEASRFDLSKGKKKSSDVEKFDVALIHGGDNSKELSMVRELLSVCKDTGESMQITKDLVVTARMEADGMDKANPMESPLIREFWNGFKLGKKENESHLPFIHLAAGNPEEVSSMVLTMALDN